MPTNDSIMNLPQPTKETDPRQRSINYSDMYMTRYMPPWSHPGALSANVWRKWVLNEPIAMVCRETIVAYLLSLDWKITPRDSNQYDELKPTIKYYTKLIERGGYALDTDYDGIIEWAGADLLDIPFGTALEIGRKNDSPTGRVMWYKPLDGGTLFPTLNSEFPIVQWYNSYDAVTFPAHAIARSYMSPVPILLREGWGMAPPEKIQLALEMLVRGDRYYANLLLDVPPAGILDLGDMEQNAATEWVNAFRLFVANTSDALKIPVLYEHTTETKFIPFGKVPNDLMFDKITMKYAAIVAAAYGMSLSDIGLQTTSASGETLAGSIRQERRTRKTGIARSKKKFKYLFQRILPDFLQFDFIDLDDELNIAIARARLANATAAKTWIENGVFTRGEIRLQTIQDGLITINVPEEPPTKPDEFQEAINAPAGGAANRQLGNKVPASSGGMGETKSKIIEKSKLDNKKMDKILDHVILGYASNVLEYAQEIGEDGLQIGMLEVLGAYGDSVTEMARSMRNPLSARKGDELHGVKDGFTEFATRSAFAAMVSVIMDEEMFDGLDDLDYDTLTEKCRERLDPQEVLGSYVESKLETIDSEDKEDVSGN